ncbi:response regulator [Dyadobacter arcticus]|uniref:DNA-binding response OmpR family regulator n=1 Tax=Dyadobacter arcticus TaxID=1078754 RepID=A0ABX0UJZ2_9BACT|nr:response regulator [Dyadobacter arcticus]NIJ53329.1 DNA-binding response OmpR family regulator [Dyadobacter arcticus]
MKIVIIEDEQDLGVLLRNFLVRQLNILTPDASVKVAASLIEGIACINDLGPDWIFIDNNLPDGKGINEIQRIKNVHKDRHTKVVMMSAMTNLKEEALKNGADFFLDKPISFVEVRNIFANY